MYKKIYLQNNYNNFLQCQAIRVQAKHASLLFTYDIIEDVLWLRPCILKLMCIFYIILITKLHNYVTCRSIANGSLITQF